MFLIGLIRTWLFSHNVIPYHILFLSYVLLLRYLRCTFIPSPYKHTFITLPFLLKCNCLYSLVEFFFSWNKTFYNRYLFSESHFSQVSRKKITFHYIRNFPITLEGLYFFGFVVCFISFPFYSLVWFLEFWESIYYFARETCFNIFYVSVKLCSLVYIFTIWECSS